MEEETSKRNGLSPRERWQVFNRDNFTCQYCGKNTRNDKNIMLEVDHIKPVAEGGTNDIENLVTSCHQCNHGKRTDSVNFPDIKKRIETKTKTFIEMQMRHEARIHKISANLTEYEIGILDSLHKNHSEAIRILIRKEEKRGLFSFFNRRR